MKCEAKQESRLSLVSPCSDSDRSELVGSATCRNYCPAPSSPTEPVARFDWLKDRLAFVTIALASVLPFAVLQFMVSYFNFLMCGSQTNQFMTVTADASSLAVYILMVLFYEMMRTLSGTGHSRCSLAVRGVAALIALFWGAAFGLGGLLAVLTTIALVFVVTYLCRLIRTAVPATFRFRRSIWNMAQCSSPGFLLVLYCIGTAISQVSPFPQNADSLSTAAASPAYPEIASFEFFVLTVFLFLMLSIPTYAAMCAARSRKTAPLALLALLYQTPFFLASFVEASMVIFRPGGLTIATAIFLCNLVAGVMLLFAANQAARVNGAMHDRQMSGSN